MTRLSTMSSSRNVAQVSNLLYRRFPIGKASPAPMRLRIHGVCRLEALRYSRLETCVTTLSAAVVTMELFNAVTMQLVC